MAPNGGQNVLGLILAWQKGYLVQALTFQKPAYTIGIGMWLALIMAFNVWFIIWPNQQRCSAWLRPLPTRKLRPQVPPA